MNQRNETKHARQTESALTADTGSAIDALSHNDRQTHELGRLIRQSANIDLPEPNNNLREQLMEQLENAPATGQNEYAYTDGRLRRWAIAASLLLAIGVCSVFLLDKQGKMENQFGKLLSMELTTRVEPTGTKEINVEPKTESTVAAGKNGKDSGGKYRTEERTRVVPYTEMVPQNQTRTVPVQRTRTETRTKKLPDGSTETYPVDVPYTEQVAQNYTVNVPVQKHRTETYSVQVPVAPQSIPIAPQSQTVAVPRKPPVTEPAVQEHSVSEATKVTYPDGRIVNLTSRTGPTNEELQRYQSLLTEQLKQKSGKGPANPAVTPNELSSLSNGKPASMTLSNGQSPTQLGLQSNPQAITRKVDGVPKSELIDFLKLKFGDVVVTGRDDDEASRKYFESLQQLSSEQQVLQAVQQLTEGQRGWHELKNTEQYKPIHENKFIAALGGEAISTFSIDVDTASYANMRRFINSNQMPPRDSVRIEELVNYFTYDYPQPEKDDDPFSVNMELATCPWNIEHKLLRVGLKGKDVNRAERPATNLVFLLDVSGSMNSQDKLPLLKQGFQMMVKELTENDTVTIVTYAGNAGVALEPTNGTETKKINEAIASLNPGGSTHGSAGIELAYNLAQKHLIKDGVNKVIMATDGDLNVGVTDDGALVKLIKEKASEGVFLTVLGFGTGNLKDGNLEQLADNGNGMYAYIDSIREARKVLVEQMSGSLVTIAKDVKLQIEFNPAEVAGYRLIGYENRMLATKDFDDDTKDAGEIGAGHTVTAIYEIVTTSKAQASTLGVAGEPMKYQTAEKVEKPKKSVNPAVNLSDAASNGELLTLALRYKKPDENVSKRIEFSIKNDEKSFSSASEDFQFAASVASFGMLLRGSRYAGNATFLSIQEIASGCIGDDKSGYRSEFLDLVRKAAENCK